MHTGKGLFSGFLIGIVLTLAVAALIGFGTVYSGGHYQSNQLGPAPFALPSFWMGIGSTSLGSKP